MLILKMSQVDSLFANTSNPEIYSRLIEHVHLLETPLIFSKNHVKLVLQCFYCGLFCLKCDFVQHFLKCFTLPPNHVVCTIVILPVRTKEMPVCLPPLAHGGESLAGQISYPQPCHVEALPRRGGRSASGVYGFPDDVLRRRGRECRHYRWPAPRRRGRSTKPLACGLPSIFVADVSTAHPQRRGSQRGLTHHSEDDRCTPCSGCARAVPPPPTRPLPCLACIVSGQRRRLRPLPPLAWISATDGAHPASASRSTGTAVPIACIARADGAGRRSSGSGLTAGCGVRAALRA